jgi:hypothetical protein
MSETDNTNQNALKVANFSHDSSTPCSIRWREWAQQEKYAFGAAFPMLANQLSEVCNPEEYWWRFEWNPLFDFETMNNSEEQKLYLDYYSKAQYSIRHVLAENFGTHEKQIFLTMIL